MHPRFALLPLFISLIGLTMPAAGAAARTDRYGDPLPDGAVFRIGTTRLRHEIGVIPPFENVLLSPDGKYVFSSRYGDVVRMWETATGREVRRFDSYSGRFSLSADGSLLAIDFGYQLRLYDAAAGKIQAITHLSDWNGPTLINPYNPRPSDNVSADRRFLTAFRTKGQPQTNHIIRYDIATSKASGTWPIDKDEPLALSGDGRLAASLGPDEQTIRLWETTGGKKVREWKMDQKAPLRDLRLTISPDSHYVAIAGKDAMIRVHETNSGKKVRNWNGQARNAKSGNLNRAAVSKLVFAPDGKTLATVDRDNILRFWDWKTGRELRHFDGVYGPVSFSADGKIVAAGGRDSRIRLWNTATGRDLCPFVDPGGIENVIFSPQGQVLAVRSDRYRARLLDARNGREMKEIPDCSLRAFSPDGSSLLAWRPSGDRSGGFCLLDAATGNERLRFPDAREGDRVGGWSPDGKYLVMLGLRRVCVYDVATGKKLRELRGKEEYPSAACSADARTVAIADQNDTRIRLFAPDTAKELRQVTGYSKAVEYQAERKESERSSSGFSGNTYLNPVFSPDGKTVLAGCDRYSFGLWDVASGKQTVRWNCREFLPIKPLFSPDGKWLALLDGHGDPCLVDAATGRLRHRLAQKGGKLSFLTTSINRAFSADGRLLAAAYDPHTIVLWETATGRQIRTWPGHGRGYLHQMVFAPDGRRLATVSADGTALVWDVTGLSPDGNLPARKLTPAETAQAWKDLADADAAKAHRAVWTLVADAERALPLLREHLHPVPGIDADRLARFLADLDSNEFTVRETATRQLRKMGEQARPALRKAMQDKPSLELRQRAQGLLDDLESADLLGENLRDRRAVAVLEHLASADAQQLLRVLTAGAPGARLTEEAKESLARLRSPRGQP